MLVFRIPDFNRVNISAKTWWGPVPKFSCVSHLHNLTMIFSKTFKKIYYIRSWFKKRLNKYVDSIVPHCNRRDDWKQKARRTVVSEPGWRIGLSKNNQPKISMCHHDRNWIYLMVLECLVTVHKSWSYLLWYVEKPDMGFGERRDFSNFFCMFLNPDNFFQFGF